MYRLSRRFRKRFGRDRTDGARHMDSLEYKIVLLDGADISFDLHRKATGQELLEMVFKNLDLVEKDYFGLQFMDNHQVSHWLDPTKKIKKQVKIGPPFTLHFRVKFYAAEPHNLGEELTRYHFFLQVKQDIHKGKLEVPLRIAVDLTAYSLQSHLGDFDQEVHKDDYMKEFKFVPQQNHELEKEIMKKHRALLGLNPAECEVNFLRISRSMDNYGIDMHPVIGDNKMEYTLGLTPRGILLIKDKQKMALFSWPKISKIAFKKNRFFMAVHEDPNHADAYTYICSSAKASKHLWKCAIEHHAFFRLVKPASNPRRTSSFLRFGSRFRYSGRTEYQTQKDARLSARKSMKFRRAASERFSKRSTIGYIRVGSRVWGKALNGDYYKGVVTGLGEMVHIKFDNGDTIAHDRTDPECVVFDLDPDPADIEIGTRVIAHWPSLPAKLPGKVIGMEHNKFYVEYDDGDKHHNTANQMRILKPPLYFGPGAGKRGVKKSESMKVTSLTGKAVITTELPRKSISKGVGNGSLEKTEQLETREDAITDAAEKLGDMQSLAGASSPASDNSRKHSDDSRKHSDDSRKHSDSTKTSRNKTDFAAVPEKKISNASTDISDLKSKLHQRSASLPCNVRHAVKDKGPWSGPPSPSAAGKKAARNKSFGGLPKPSARAPVDIFSLPETDIDSGITVACDSKSGKASRRNMHSLDLLKDSEPNKSEKTPGRVGRSKSDGEKRSSQRRVPRQRDTRSSCAAPYAPNFLETSLDGDNKDSAKGMFDAQRTFHVFVPDSRWNGDKQDVESGEKPLSRRRRNSLPEVRSIHFEDEDEDVSLGAGGETTSKKDKTSSLNDLAKTSPTSTTKQAPLHIDNLFSTAEGHQGGSGSCTESPNFSPTPERKTSNNRLVQVTDL